MRRKQSQDNVECYVFQSCSTCWTCLCRVVTEERDPEQIRKDLERLELIRKKR